MSQQISKHRTHQAAVPYIQGSSRSAFLAHVIRTERTAAVTFNAGRNENRPVAADAKRHKAMVSLRKGWSSGACGACVTVAA